MPQPDKKFNPPAAPAGRHPLETQPAWGAAIQLGAQAMAAFGPGIAGWMTDKFGPWGYVIGGALGFGDSLTYNALVKPPKKEHIGGKPGMPFHGVRNEARPYEVLQEVFGRMRVYPPLAADPYTEQVGSETWVRMLLHIGSGEYEISDIKIGESPITNYAGDYETADGYITDAAVQAIYPEDVAGEGTLPLEVTHASGGLIKTTQADTTEISVDVGCPQGLFQVFDSGHYRGNDVGYTLQYRVSSPPGAWNDFPGSPFSQKKKTQGYVGWNHRVTGLAPDTYDVQLVKTSTDHPPPDGGKTAQVDVLYWLALRSIRSGQAPVADENAYLLALRLKISGNFSSAVDTVNCIAERKVPTWNGSAWTANTKTRSAAWAYAAVLRSKEADSRINGDALLTWAGNCTAKGFNFDAVIDSGRTIKELLEDIAAVGRASRAIIDDLHTVIEDVAQAANLAHFTPRNSWGFTGHRDFIDIPHALKCRYIDQTNGYQTEEIYVYRSGYDAGSATKFESMTFFGVTDPEHVWKLAQYYFAVAGARSETFTISVDAENLRNTRGDRVGLTYDVMQAGLGQARIKAIDGNDVTMDDAITMAAGNTYGAIVRKADGTFLTTSIALDVGTQYTVTLGAVTGIAADDLIVFGLTDEVSQDCIIKGIEYGDDLTAKLTLTNYAAGIQDADGGTPPSYTPVITAPPLRNRVPPAPTIDGVTVGYWSATDNDLADKRLYAMLNFYAGMSAEIEPYYYQVQYRSYDDVAGDDIYSPWQYAPDLPAEAREVHIPVQDGSFYDFRIRAVSRYGVTSAWAEYNDYEVAYAGPVPDDIAGLALVQGGSTWPGEDCAVSWTLPADTWRVKKIKITVLQTSGSVELRTEYVDPAQVTYVYTLAMNREDTGGNPVGGLTIRAWGISQNGDASAGAAELVVTHAAPTSVSGLSGAAVTGGVEFTWAGNTDDAFSHFEYRVKVGAALNGEAWLRTQSPHFTRILTDAEKAAYGSTASIYFEVRAVDTFGTASSAASGSQSAAGLAIDVADVTDYILTPQKFDMPLPLVDGLSIVSNSDDGTPGSAPGYVYWSAFSLYLSGTLYSISAGYTNAVYACFKDFSATLQTTSVHPGQNWSDWDPSQDFMIVWNNSGTGKDVWKSFMNVVITATMIGTAAIKSANIESLDVAKLTAGIITVALQLNSLGTLRTNTPGNYPYIEISNSGIQLKDADEGGTVGTAVVGTDKIGFGATVWMMNDHYQIPWMETKEPKDNSGNDMPSLRLYNRSALPSGGTYATGDIVMVNGQLVQYDSGDWYTLDRTIAT